MINKYNIYKVLIAISVFSVAGWLLSICFLNNTNIQVFQELFQSTIDFFRCSSIWSALGAAILFIVEVGCKCIEKDSITNILKSHMATHTLRKFAHTFGSKRNINSPTETNETVSKGKANRSLQTLVVTYYNDSATMKIKLPADHEGRKTIKALFPDVKAELNELDSNFLFSDIVRQKNRIYQTTAKRVVARG